jgi:ATP-dependent Clp protease ATP-binding subunit ClpA
MFERFTDRARRVVVLAQEDAREFKHNYIGSEHLLLGLVHEGEGVAAQALDSLGVSLTAVRSQLEEIIGHGQSDHPGHIPFAPRAKKVLELSLREALQLGHNYIGTEHLLLALVREGEGIGAQILGNLGADLQQTRDRVIHVLGIHQAHDDYSKAKPKDASIDSLIRTIVREEIKNYLSSLVESVSTANVTQVGGGGGGTGGALDDFLNTGAWASVSDTWSELLRALFGIDRAA